MPPKSLIGAHVSVAGGVDKAAKRAKTQGCEVMQIFVQSPQTYRTPITTPEEIKKFKISLQKNDIQEFYVHAPYLVNFASLDNRIRYGSISLVRKNLERASLLGAKYLMTHLGSYGDLSQKEGIKMVKKALEKIILDYAGSCQLLLELSAGSGHILGSRFEELGEILNSNAGQSLGVCLDTAHIFASGYNLDSEKSINQTIKLFSETIGLNKLKLVHLNDSAVPCNSHKDRHADLGDGLIGLESFRILINHPKFQSVNIILETPGSDRRRLEDIQLLKSFRH